MDKDTAMLIEDEKLDNLVDAAKDWAQAHGLCIRSKCNLTSSDFVEIAPFSLVPSRVPKRLFDQAYDVQKDMSLLYHKVSFDYDFIRSSLAGVIKTDSFTKRLMEIYDTVHNSGNYEQQTVLTIQRPDYMFHDPTASESAHENSSAEVTDNLLLKQVEVNNMASSAAGIGSTVTELHREILRQLQFPDVEVEQRLPANRGLRTVAEGLTQALKHYNVKDAAVLFVVEKINRNIFDQRLTEYEILKTIKANSAFRVLRLTLDQCCEQLYLSTENRLVVKDSETEIGVVYFRAGYVPQHYPTEIEWKGRILIEKSKAIKCPWIGAHLAGSKKIQQVLADPEVLKKYVQDDAARKRIADTFVGLYGLEAGNSSTEIAVAKACANPDAFVLKPQLEGGGNNFYGAQVKVKLLSMTPEEREAYILMERIRPHVHENIPVRAHAPVGVKKMVSEFGTFGYLLGDKSHVIANESGGHLMRTKGHGIDEGGLMTGSSVLDSPYLV